MGPIPPNRASFLGLSEHALAELYRSARIAAGELWRGGATGVTFQGTALVNEAVRKCLAGNAVANSKPHAHALIAKAVRQVFFDYLDARKAQKRNSGEAPVPLLESDGAGEPLDLSAMLDLRQAFDQLRDCQPKAADVLECKYYGGMSEVEIARAMGASRHDVSVWRKSGLAFLRVRLAEEGGRS